ncbi:MAG: hypothetical protein ACJ8KA_10255 [Sulfurifustis sp.]
MNARRMQAHEQSDLHVRNVLWTAVVLIAAIALVHLVVYALLLMFHGSAGGTPWRHNAVQELPAAFHTYPTAEALRREQEAKLESYGWVDRERGVARIPIERAMELYVERHHGERVGARDPAATEDCAMPTRTANKKECGLVVLPADAKRQPSATPASGERNR